MFTQIVQGGLKEDKETYALFRCTESVRYCVAGWLVVKIVGHGCEGEDVAFNSENV